MSGFSSGLSKRDPSLLEFPGSLTTLSPLEFRISYIVGVWIFSGTTQWEMNNRNGTLVACIASVSMGLGTKERPRNGILLARNWGESQNKKEGLEEGKCDTIFAIFLLSVWSLSCPNSKDFALFDLFVLSQAIIHAPLSSLWRFLFYRSRLCSSQLAYFILYYLVLPWVYEGFFRWQSTGFD